MATIVTKYKPYPTYKPSAVEWLGEIPAHWDVRRLKHLLREPLQYGANEASNHIDPDSPRYIRITDIREDGTLWQDTFRSIPQAVARPYLLAEGDLLFARSGATVGKTFRYLPSWGKAAFAGYLIRARLDYGLLGSDFAEYYTHSQSYNDWILGNQIQSPTIQNVSAERYASLVVTLPPLPEQRAIAGFLDRATAKIDSLVAKMERLIELLQEKRSALISRAVTKGLDPKVPMKHSGAEWLGKIPAHWEVKRLKYVADFINGAAFKPDEWLSVGTPIIRIQNLNGGDHFNHTTRKMPVKYIAQRGDLLFGWSGNRGTSFGPFLWWRDGKHFVNQHIFRVIPINVTKEWFYWALRAVTFHAEQQAHGIIGMVHITRDELGAIYIPFLPDTSEQRAIAGFLDRETAKIDTLIAKVREAIDRLTELRTALISAAVTGRIDVRGEAV